MGFFGGNEWVRDPNADAVAGEAGGMADRANRKGKLENFWNRMRKQALTNPGGINLINDRTNLANQLRVVDMQTADDAFANSPELQAAIRSQQKEGLMQEDAIGKNAMALDFFFGAADRQGAESRFRKQRADAFRMQRLGALGNQFRREYQPGILDRIGQVAQVGSSIAGAAQGFGFFRPPQ
jgi:hypothetical protein